MNLYENIAFLAQANARRCHPKRFEEIKKDIPYFKIFKTQLGTLDIVGEGHQGHDNQDRMLLWEAYMRTAILPNIKDDTDITGYYNIELHDSYTYLNNNKSYDDVLTFAKFKDDAGPILIPDPYMICNWGNMLSNLTDSLSYDSKLNKVCFYGTTTGNRNPSLNERLKTCIWSLDHQDFCEFKITKVAQMPVSSITSTYGEQRWKDIYLPRHVSVPEQIKYKFQLWIDGNTCRYDVWAYKTNSLVFKPISKDMLWYYPLMRSGYEYVEVTDLNKLQDMCTYYTNNNHIAKHLIANAQLLSVDLFKPLSHTIYTVSLFEQLAANKA